MTDQPIDEKENPKIYLITPSDVDLSTYPDLLAACLDSTDVSCVRLGLATKDEDRIARAADALRLVTHERDVALVIETHLLMVERLGLDGVHRTDGARNIKSARKELGEDAIVGSYCQASRHDAMTACELGADYVSFGPVGATPLGDGVQAELDLFEWWSAMIEVPVVAEGALSDALIRQFAPHTDFFALGDEVWNTDDPVETLKALAGAML